jgi:hypothetical protein
MSNERVAFWTAKVIKLGREGQNCLAKGSTIASVTTENGSGGETKGKDVRDIFEGHATESGYSSRCWGRLLSAVLIGDSIEMYGF